MTLKREWVFSWAALRLPLLGLVLYLLRYQLLAWFEGMIGFMGRMDFFVFTISTITTRLLLFVFFASGLGIWFWLTGKLKVTVGIKYVISLTGTFLGIYLAFTYLFLTPDAFLRTAIITVLIALNTIPYEWITKWLGSGIWISPIFLAGIGFVEALFPQAYIAWLMNLGQAKDSLKRWSWLSGVLVASFLWVFLLIPHDSQRVFTLAERLHANPSVQRFAPGLYNWVELNPEHGLLYAVGRGTNFLLAFDVNHLDQPPKRSREDIGKTQSFGFNPVLQEIYVYKAETRELLYMDALTLDVLRSVPVPELSPGDVWVKWVQSNGTIIISSEADAEIGTPVYIIDQETEKIIATIDFPVIPTAYLIVHPNEPLMYFNSFKDNYFAVWSMETQKITSQVDITPRTDRMVFFEKDNEVWIASPLDGSILRYDADTLENKGVIKTRFGVRTLTIDTKRNLLLVGNFMNNRLDVIELNTNQRIASFYLGPWIRTIALDMEQGLAYVSTVRGLFKVNYVPPVE